MEQTSPFSKIAGDVAGALARAATASEASAASGVKLDAGHVLAWQLLRWWNLARAVLSGLLVALFFTHGLPPSLGHASRDLFIWTAVAYFCFSLVASFTVSQRRPRLEIQAYTQVCGDIGAIVLLMFASGGVGSGLGELLLVPIAAASLLLSLRFALGFAALATLTILAQESLLALGGNADGGSYVQAGLLGVVFFAIAALSQRLAERLRESELLTTQRGLDIANLATLNDFIIQHTRTGIIVIDGNDRLRLANPAASATLGLIHAHTGAPPLALVAPRLKALLDDWRAHRSDALRRDAGTLTTPDELVLVPHFNPLGAHPGAGTVIFLEDGTQAAEQVRQMKLAALGRLTASIAHEIRNPLGAIGHAHQLIAESETLPASERRLVEIIGEHTGRVNRIVESILKLSRGGDVKLEQIDLGMWIQRFTAEFRERNSLGEEDARLTVVRTRGPLSARVDANQLHQIVWNLAENALRYGMPKDRARYGDQSLVEFRLGLRRYRNQPYLEVLDHGNGIAPEFADQVFEPFYTSSSQGTGLGLFIARELCECNHATLTYHARSTGGSCFRITFADPESWIV